MASTTISEADQLLLKNNASLSAADIKTYNIKKAQLFKATIAVCAIYGTIALVILLLTLFSFRGSQIFTEEIRPFTLTFIGGMIFVIALLILQILSFKPKAFTVSVYDKDVCPDFWKLVPTPTNDPVYTSASVSDKSLLQYYCTPDKTVFNTMRTNAPSTNPYNQKIDGGNTYVYKSVTPDSTNPALTALIGPNGNNGLITNQTLGVNNIQCDKVFPNYLANNTSTNGTFKDKPNALACEYARQCGISWTSQCGN